MIKKIISNGEIARAKLLEGVNKVGDCVGSTLGPNGRNAIIYRKYKAPLITNDGVTIARHIYMDDVISDLGAQTIVEAALRTNDQAGDGTTTTVVIASALAQKGFDLLKGNELSSKPNAMSIFRNINAEKTNVLAILKESARPLKKGELGKIISTSLENLEVGKTIAEMIQSVGQDGYIAVEDNWATQYGVTSETILGMKQHGTYATPLLVTNARKEAVWEDAPILVTNHDIQSASVLKRLIDEVRAKGKMKFVIVAESFSKPMIQTIAGAIIQARQGNAEALQILAIKAPALTSQELEDVAVFCDATFINKNAGMELKDVSLLNLGYAKKVVANEDEFIITEGRGNKEERLKILNEQLKLEKDPMFKEKMKRRIASLSSGIGIIRVGAMTETERGYLKLKIEDAVNAGKAALEEGVVKGGGLALKEIAESLGDKNILYEALMSPYKKIQENAGGKLDIADDVLDPVKVTRLAFENAVSAAGTLITTETAISEKKQTLWDMLDQRLTQGDERNDFRDMENMDMGAGKLIEA
jgi:chaperonin GroEL